MFSKAWVMNSVQGGKGVHIPACTGAHFQQTPPLGRHPWKNIPQADIPWAHTLEQKLPGQTPLGRYPLGRDPMGIHPQADTPWADTP